MVTSSTMQALAMPALVHHSSRTRLLAAARSGVARMVRATMSSSGPSEVATRSRNQPLIASRMRAPMSKKPGPLPNGGGSRLRSRSRTASLAAGGAVVVVGGRVVGAGGPSVLGGVGGPGVLDAGGATGAEGGVVGEGAERAAGLASSSAASASPATNPERTGLIPR